ncbi:hypothetical protein FOA52_011776 [Chlamydomonas sp. UWO 241]|nr:hypothetical protein FOA52_011776 [Chlamydomonas sp. UWO 241]
MSFSAEQQQIISATQSLLDGVAGGDYDVYTKYCAADMTCLEPEAIGHQVEGLAFHKFYFDNLSFAAAAEAQAAGKASVLNTIVSPKVRMLGTNAAVISYIRLVQSMTAEKKPSTVQWEETRVWEKTNNENWMLVHFHKSRSA